MSTRADTLDAEAGRARRLSSTIGPGILPEAAMIHSVFPVGLLACNCSILGDEETGEAIVIDPGDDVERVLEVLAKHNLQVKYLIATHAHIDHVGGLEKLKRTTGAAVLMHAGDLPLYQNLELQAAWLGVPAPGAVEVDQFLKEGDVVESGSLALEVLHTPGHSPGSLCLHMPGGERRLFSGDTLFQGSIGRTDLWGGSFDEILRSIHSTLLKFPDETPVFPGHGPPTTIGRERETNPFLQNL
jgi:glyoxylase-like metal-dependent hydrolase (beta-lactamase superfamily II)